MTEFGETWIVGLWVSFGVLLILSAGYLTHQYPIEVAKIVGIVLGVIVVPYLFGKTALQLMQLKP